MDTRTLPTASAKEKNRVYNAEEYLSLHDQYYQRYIYKAGEDPNRALGYLYASCRFLAIAAVMNDDLAKAVLESEMSQKDIILTHELDKLCTSEFLCNLEQIQPNSAFYAAAKYHQFLILYSAKANTAYDSHTTRMNEIYSAFEHLLDLAQHGKYIPPVLQEFAKKMITNYPVKNKALLDYDAKRAFIYELLGQDKLVEVAKKYYPKADEPVPYNHPFRLATRQGYEQLITEVCDADSAAIAKWVNKIEAITTSHFTKIPCARVSPDKYIIKITTEELARNPKAGLCYVDSKTGIEIGRFTLTENGLMFKAYGDHIDLEITGALNYPLLMLDNPEGDISIKINSEADHPIFIAADVKTVNFNGHLQSKHPIRIDARGKVNIAKTCKIESASQLGLRALELDLQGELAADEVCQLHITSTIEMAPKSKCTAKKALSITANALKDIRGNISSEGHVKVETTDSIYLHGDAVLHGGTGLNVTSRALFTTDKATVSSDKQAQINVATTVDVYKECKWSMPYLDLHAQTFKNYSPNIKVKNGSINCSQETINYPTGVIKAQEFLRFTGGSVWNGGLIDFGQTLQLKLNKLFVHGIISLSDLKNIRKCFNTARIEGGDVNIIAGVVLEVLSTKRVRSLNLAAIAEINIALTTSVSSRKSRLIALDAGIDIPDIRRTCEDIYEFCQMIQKGDYKNLFANILTRNRLISAMNFARWCVRTLLPGAGVTVDMVWNSLILLSTTPRLYGEYCNLCSKYRSKKIEASDIISLLATTSNFATQAVALESQIVSLLPQKDPSEEKSADPTAPAADEKKSEPVSVPPIEPRPLIDIIPPLALDFALLFMPCSTEEAVFAARVGGLQANTALLNRTGMSYTWLSTRLGLNITDTFYQAALVNVGTYAGRISEVGDSLYQSGRAFTFTDSVAVTNQIERRKVYAHQVDWRNSHLDEKAEISAAVVNAVSQDEAKFAGKMTADRLFIKSKILEQTHESEMEVKGTEIIEAEKATLAGEQKAGVFYANLSEATQLTETGHVTAKKIVLDGGKDVKILGTLSVTGAPIENKSENGKPIIEPVLSVTGTAVVVGKTGHLEALHGVSVVNADQLEVDGTDEAKTVVLHTKQSTEITRDGSVKGDEVDVDAGKKFILDSNALVQATGESKKITSEDGTTTTNPALRINADEVKTEAGSRITAANGVSVINADQAAIGGADEAKTVVIQTKQSTEVTRDATVKGDEVDIDAGKKFILGSGGLIQATAESKKTTSEDGTTTNPALRIKADEVKTEAGSKITVANGVSVINADQAAIGGADEAKTIVIHTKQSTEITRDGSVKGDEVDIDAGKKFILGSGGLIQATGESKKTTSEDGTTINPALRVKADEVNAEAESKITATNGASDIDSVNATLAGEVSGTIVHVKASNHLDTKDTGHLTATAPDGTVALEASTASLAAPINAFDISLKIDHVPDIQDLLLTAGIYRNINPTSMLRVWTQDAVTLDRSINVNYGFALSAAGITVRNDLYSKGNIALNARNGNVITEGRTVTTETTTSEVDYSKAVEAAVIHGLRVKDLFAVDKNGNYLFPQWIPMRTTTTTETHVVPYSIHSDQVLSISANGSYFNDRCQLSGTEFYIDVQGSAINHGGTWAASQYLQIQAALGDIENQCIVHDIQGRYDILNSYEIAHMLGGSGAGHNGVGFAAVCGGRLINDASEISSLASNYINAMLGIDSLSRYHQFIDFEKHSRNFWGRETTKRDISTQVQTSLIYSAQGKNTLVSEGGDIHSLSTQFIAPLGNSLTAKGNVLIEGIVAEDKHYESSSSLWGLIRHDVTQGNPFAVPTTLLSLGDISITSLQDVMLTNFAVFTPGTLNLSGKNILISAPILQNTRTELSCTFGFSGPQFPCQNSVPLYSDLQSLSHSRGSAEWAANSWNTFVDGANTVNGLIAGMRAGSLANAIFPTSSMTLAELDYTRTATRTRWQTVAPGVGAQCGGLVMNAVNDLSIINGVPIFDSGDAQIHAKRFLQQGAALHSSISSDTETLGTGVSVEGDPTFSLTASRSGTVATNYANQVLQVGGTLSLDVHEWDMDAANLIAGTLTGHADLLSIQSRADTSSSYSQCAQINSNGSFSYQQGGHDSAKIGIVSGIRVGNGSSFSVDDTSLIGGKLSFDALNGFSTKTLQAQSIAEHDKSSSYGICGNINDITGDTASRQWSQAIPYVGIQRGLQDWQATQHSTLYGTHGGAASIQSVSGALNTADESGLRVVRDDRLCYEVKVPIYNKNGIKQLTDNVLWLGDQLGSREGLVRTEPPAYLRHSTHADEKHVPQEEKHKAIQKIDDDMPELIDESDDDMPELIDEQEVKAQDSTHASKEERQVDDDFIKTAEMIANAPIQDVSLYYSKNTYRSDDEDKSLIALVGSSGQTDVTLGSSDSRRTTSQAETKTVGRSYLLDPDKQDCYKYMLFSSSLSRPSTPPSQDTASQQYSSSLNILTKLANSRMVAGINTVGSWIADTPVVRGINLINPLVVVPEMLDQAHQSFASGNISDALATTGFAVLSAMPGDVPVVNIYKSSMTYLSGRVGMFGSRQTNGLASETKIATASEELTFNKITQILPKHPLSGLSPANVVYLAHELGLETPRDQLILWSGLGKNGIEESQLYAKANGGMTLEMTPGGKWLLEVNIYSKNSPFTQEEATQIWDELSRLTTSQASGQVRSLLGNVRPGSIYKSVEFPELINNPNVLGIDEINIKPRIIFR